MCEYVVFRTISSRVNKSTFLGLLKPKKPEPTVSDQIGACVTLALLSGTLGWVAWESCPWESWYNAAEKLVRGKDVVGERVDDYKRGFEAGKKIKEMRAWNETSRKFSKEEREDRRQGYPNGIGQHSDDFRKAFEDDRKSLNGGLKGVGDDGDSAANHLKELEDEQQAMLKYYHKRACETLEGVVKIKRVRAELANRETRED